MSLWESAAAAGREAQLAVKGVAVECASARTVTGLFVQPQEPEESVPGQFVVFAARVSDFPSLPQKGDRLTRAGIVYTVLALRRSESEPDWIRLTLEQA